MVVNTIYIREESVAISATASLTFSAVCISEEIQTAIVQGVLICWLRILRLQKNVEMFVQETKFIIAKNRDQQKESRVIFWSINSIFLIFAPGRQRKRIFIFCNHCLNPK